MEKQELIALANDLLSATDLSNRKEDLQLFRKEYKFLLTRDEDSFYEKQQTDKLIDLFKQLAERDPKLLSSPREEKKRIILAAKELSERNDILVANKELDRLQKEFTEAGRCQSKEEDDELWGEFRQAKDNFYAKKRAYFEALDRANAEKRAKKEELIEKAKAVLEIDDIKQASEQMDTLWKEWKEVGYSGKGDDALWHQFNLAVNEFRAKKKQHHAELLAIFDNRAEAKEELIKTAKNYLANSEFTPEEIEAIKGLRAQYKAIGFAGKEREEDLYRRFDAILKQYFEEMKFYI